VRDDAPPELLFCPRPAVLAVAAFGFAVAFAVFALAAFVSTFALAAFVFASAFVLALAAFAVAFAFETSWAKAAPDHATDPNNMAAKPASVRARANLIVSICRSPTF
jgi:hypothetical protein